MLIRELAAAAIGLVVALAPSFQSSPVEEERGGTQGSFYTDVYEQGIFFAVLEGLYVDGVGNDVVDRLTEVDEVTGYPAHFVYACPICMPALNAMKLYRGRPVFTGSKTGANAFGPGLPDELRARLLGDDDLVRHGAIRELVETWVSRRLESMRLTDDERDDWADAIAGRSEKGMELLRQYKLSGLNAPFATMESCPYCDGATGACEVR